MSVYPPALHFYVWYVRYVHAFACHHNRFISEVKFNEYLGVGEGLHSQFGIPAGAVFLVMVRALSLMCATYCSHSHSELIVGFTTRRAKRRNGSWWQADLGHGLEWSWRGAGRFDSGRVRIRCTAAQVEAIMRVVA
eukprot:SAG25_NODE_625_length_6379_cov_111.932803_6_plen_136_part_00